MIILDTNVLSALMRPNPDVAVVTWLDEQPSESIWTTAVSVLEVRTGLELLRPTKNRHRLEASFAQVIAEDLQYRILPLDTAAAEAAGRLVAANQRAGRPVEIRDAQIAGITKARKATLATGNIRHFEHADIRLVNPWQDTR